MVVNIVVIGAGVIGLSTALNVQLKIPNSKVKVIAESYDTETTSYGSGGIIFPTKGAHSKDNYNTIRKWFLKSAEFYRSLATGPEAGKCGACLTNGYILNRTEFTDPLLKECVLGYRELDQTELNQLNVSKEFKYGYQATTIIVDQRKYLQWLLERFLQNGGVCEKRKVQSFEEFVGVYDVVMNCTGLGSRDLLGDQTVYAVRGQVLKVKCPWVKNWYANTDDSVDFTFVIPGVDLVTLGSTKQAYNESTIPDPAETDDVLQRCRQLVPHITTAEIDHVWVGLRPARDNIRVEAETMNLNRGSLKVVHNYGHYANGVALAWGTSASAAEIAKAALFSHKSRL